MKDGTLKKQLLRRVLTVCALYLTWSVRLVTICAIFLVPFMAYRMVVAGVTEGLFGEESVKTLATMYVKLDGARNELIEELQDLTDQEQQEKAAMIKAIEEFDPADTVVFLVLIVVISFVIMLLLMLVMLLYLFFIFYFVKDVSTSRMYVEYKNLAQWYLAHAEAPNAT